MPNSLKIWCFLLAGLLVVPGALPAQCFTSHQCCCSKALAVSAHQASIRNACCCKKTLDQTLDAELGNSICCAALSGSAAYQANMPLPETCLSMLCPATALLTLDFKNTGQPQSLSSQYSRESSLSTQFPPLRI
jgi:hypothetical protein